MPIVLSIAGLDPSGGAGILADIKTFSAFGCFGTAAISSITSQNTVKVFGAYHQSGEVLRSQIEPVIADFEIAAIKTGMLPTAETIDVVAEIIEREGFDNVVVDPVIRSTSGYDLIDDQAMLHLKTRLFPLANIITPNMAESARLSNHKVETIDEMKSAAREIFDQCSKHRSGHRNPAILVKGGHLIDSATDILFDGVEFHIFDAPKLATQNTHGTGCTLSSAIAALLAKGFDLNTAVGHAKRYVSAAIESAPEIGHGARPINHNAKISIN